MLKMSVAIGEDRVKKVVCSQQFHVKYGESFVLTFQNDGEPFSIKFIQKIDPKKVRLLSTLKYEAPPPEIEVDKELSKEDLVYVLKNFNQTKVTTNPIPFYAKEPFGHYFFQLSALSISDVITDEKTIWLYTVMIYETD